jgi:hypothetical protein
MNFAIISKQLEDYYEYSYNLAGCSSLICCFECPKIRQKKYCRYKTSYKLKWIIICILFIIHSFEMNEKRDVCALKNRLL